MSTAELKIDLINQITTLTDKAKLKELLQILKFQSEKSIYVTNDDEKVAIAEAKSQIARGAVLANEDIQKELKEWLKK